ncbi:hypothetical protein HNP99_003026 [Flavobacterium sp. 28A]|uniref:hypothetical protein n=1 Tax=Flavobacterium sp. 28A TaxID=2735895 RepID=UPI00156FB565|nr:hypothetical protein [Flavobacterium sp. 28A]NRT16655.1 hypothetical protein [Flavobacterium sp. 28A]
MNKFIALLLILIIAPLLGGFYGMIHDQITYSVSSEYYTKFKFIQFGIDSWGMAQNIGTDMNPEIQLDNPRLGAAIVGFLATWWVGMIIGLFLGFLGLIHKNGKVMFIVTIKAFCLTIAIALITGIVGLGFGKLFINDNLADWNLPENVLDVNHFIMVGSMHNFSYLGGLIGLVFAVIYSVKQKKKFT